MVVQGPYRSPVEVDRSVDPWFRPWISQTKINPNYEESLGKLFFITEYVFLSVMYRVKWFISLSRLRLTEWSWTKPFFATQNFHFYYQRIKVSLNRTKDADLVCIKSPEDSQKEYLESDSGTNYWIWHLTWYWNLERSNITTFTFYVSYISNIRCQIKHLFRWFKTKPYTID